MASSEPDPNGVDGGDGGEDKNIVKQVIQEKWWQTTLQVSIPFLIAGIGTIGAGIILGRVEVSLRRWLLFLKFCLNSYTSKVFAAMLTLIGNELKNVLNLQLIR